MTSSSIVITGLGAVSPHGLGVAALWDGLVQGRSAAGPITAFDASGFGVRFACEVTDPLVDRLPRKLLRQTDRFAQMALVAAEEALVQAGLLGEEGLLADVDPDRVGAVVGSGVGGIGEMTTQHRRLMQRGPDRVRPYLSIALPINMAGGQIAIRHGLRGPVSGVVSACASGADAIGHAVDMLRAGRVDVVVTGGAEAAIDPLTMAGFDASRAMSRRNTDPAGASRPFDVDRDGFVAGEGAGILVLERESHAVGRGAPVLGRLAGHAASNDAHDPTRPSPGGEGAARALRLALADADLGTRDVAQVNAHGTSTVLNDVAESQALVEVFGTHRPVVTANKSSIGHLLGAAGAVEAIASIMSLRSRTVPPTLNLHRQDPACDVDVATQAVALQDGAVVSSSFGFGGHNAVLVFTT